MERVIIAETESECIRKYCAIARVSEHYKDYKIFFYKIDGNWVKTYPGKNGDWPIVPSSYREALSTALEYNL